MGTARVLAFAFAEDTIGVSAEALAEDGERLMEQGGMERELSNHEEATRCFQAAYEAYLGLEDLQGQALAKATRHAMQQQLAQCKAALQAVARDEYGLCRRCEEPIGFPRLQAKPESPFCLACQRSTERP